jgi:hypothetical protein
MLTVNFKQGGDSRWIGCTGHNRTMKACQQLVGLVRCSSFDPIPYRIQFLIGELAEVWLFSRLLLYQ